MIVTKSVNKGLIFEPAIYYTSGFGVWVGFIAIGINIVVKGDVEILKASISLLAKLSTFDSLHPDLFLTRIKSPLFIEGIP